MIDNNNPPSLSSFPRRRESSVARLRDKDSCSAIHTQCRLFFIPALILLLSLPHVSASATAAQLNTIPAESAQLQKCLARADDLPDIAAAEATVWIKKNGGNDAHLCRAFAQANRGMHADAAREFWGLASTYDKSDLNRALTMHNFSGQEFLRAKDIKNAETQYNSALKISSNNVISLIGHAETRMASERYWEALDDLNRALKSKPDDISALRQRGSTWLHLGNDKNAEEDFEHADTLDKAPQTSTD